MQSRTRFVAAALGLAITFWLASSLREPEEVETLPAARSDYLLEEFDLLVMDPSGRPSFRVQSPYLEKNQEDESVTITTPHLTLFEAGEVTWQMQSDSAWINREGDEIWLPGPVKLASEQAPLTIVNTSDVTVLPQENLASSEAAVEVIRADMRSEGVGFEVDLSRQQFDILSQVKGFYEPPS
ncbi:MAG: LPS export ABC transporter periplasmic protein LptC [Pseudomonadota bacterium]